MHFDRAGQYLKTFDFERLFIEELGWDIYRAPLEITMDGVSYTLQAVAEKRGFVVYLCPPLAGQPTPDHPTRSKIEQQVTRSVREHLLIFTDPAHTTQIWQWVKREPGKPVARREHHYHIQQSGHALLQKLQAIAFSLAEEEGLTLVDVTGGIRAAFDLERVTRRFYDLFKKERDAFHKFLSGIPDGDMQRWYVSVMLNRLMFIYFIQKKGFLNGDDQYLRHQLAACQQQGHDRFYREFLCPLFFEGFAQKPAQRSPATGALLGQVPYLNGSLFVPHPVERQHGEAIQIADAAFSRLFDFFEQYQWHLDERPLRSDNEINPDVLGYIFEKYINQKQMGAYYTKEDITGYIGQNTILPFLLDETRQQCRVAFEGEQAVWRLLTADPDRYIYEALKHGVDQPLPPEIAAGLEDVFGRAAWQQPAPPDYGLPTEIWRETVARRQRYAALKARLAAGEVCAVNDFITYNLNLRQFAQDVLETCEGPELLRAFYRAIEGVAILDPTAGSGAFLFAALNILEPLYEACLERMAAFVADDDLPAGVGAAASADRPHPARFSDFRRILARVDEHPNRRYFVFKSIIVNNLFGVDIMEEAVEICKLRLFLKLVAQVERGADVEPLPDIDFNIRAGNTLVGYATANEVRQAFTTAQGGQMKLLMGQDTDAMRRFEEKAGDVDRLFQHFRQQQTELGGQVTAEDKQELRRRLQDLEDELNRYLAGEYGVDASKKVAYRKWLESHQPFHWFIEFYGILKQGGFDVIIGNPPYVEYKKVKSTYTIRGYDTEDCGDLYAFVMERSNNLIRISGRMGMIIPVSIVSTDGFNNLRRLLQKDRQISWTLNFAERPSKLFSGVEKRLTIWLTHKSQKPSLFLSKYRRWFSDERDFLFASVPFVAGNEVNQLVGTSIPKVCTSDEIKILKSLSKQRPLSTYFMKISTNTVYYTRKLRYFVQFFDFIPTISDEHGNQLHPSELKTINLSSKAYRDVMIAVLNSNLFFWFLTVHSDVRNVNRREIEMFRCSIDLMNNDMVMELERLSQSLMTDFQANSRLITNNYGEFGKLTIQSFQPRLSKPIINEIDRVLAHHYGFTAEELDFIINYDIKYRLGSELLEEEDEAEEE